jgi:threonine dehydrogenase-like Zn-dependent dehydrogenase
MKALYFDNDLKKILAVKVASAFSKNAALGPLSPVRYGDVPEPAIPNGRWMKVKNKVCGLCGTDIHFIFMELDPKTFSAAVPGIERKFLGHELLGEVVELGDEVKDFSVGDRIALRIEWPSCKQMEIDPPCEPCASGSYMLCENLGVKDLPMRDLGQGFSPVMVLHKSQPFKLPDELPDERAILLEPTASALHGVMKRLPGAGEKALVLGAGTIGLLAVAVAKTLQPDSFVACVARHKFQIEAAKKMGADAVLSGKDLYSQAAKATGARKINGYFGNQILLGGFDIIYDTVGNDRSIGDALRWIKAGGDLVILGINFKPGRIDYTPIWQQELKVTGINCHATEHTGENSFEMAAEVLTKTPYPVEELVTHRFPMSRYKEAIKTFLNKNRTGAIKIVLEHD